LIKIVALVVKRDDLTAEAFRSYYEHHHAPLIESLSPTVAAYHRSYVDHSSLWTSTRGTTELGIDAITELWFPDAAAYAVQEEVMRRPDVRRRVAEDEAQFMRRDLTRIFRVDEVVSAVAGTGQR
jgi:hypothetical protein